MNPDDYAILVGIDKYPELGQEDTALDLKGPPHDVEAVKAWLVDPQGGGLPDQNVFDVPSSARADMAPGRPNASDLSQLLAVLQKKQKDGGKLQLGRRIYIYMSGHGFSPGRRRACLYTADARQDQGENVHATGWLNWLQDSGYFREFVLWVDACMDRQSFFPPGDPKLRPVNVGVPPLASFVAFAAQRPLKAVEQEIAEDSNKVHGAFTWALLQGLRGAAADVNGRVTGRSLADWLRNAMSARYDPRDRQDRDVAQEPDVIAEDSGLIFSRGAVAPHYAVTFTFPQSAAGTRARVWTGAPPAVSMEFDVGPSPTTLPLKPGLYVVEVENAGLRHGFEVLNPVRVEVKDSGPSVDLSVPGNVFELTVASGSAAGEIFVIDSRFSLVDCGTSRLSTPLPRGLFKIKVRIGNALTEQVILLDRDQGADADAEPGQEPATVIPLENTGATHEYHEKARRDAIAAARALAAPRGKAVVLLLARTFSSRTAPVPNTAPPWRGVQLVDASGQVLIDMENQSQAVHLMTPDASAYCVLLVEPGSYFLRQSLDSPTLPAVAGHHAPAAAGPGYPIEQSVIACAGWRTEVYVLRRVVPGAVEVDGRPRVAIAMRRHDAAMNEESEAEDRLAEAAKLALANERKILSDDLERTLMLKSGNPVAAIIGCHLLLVEQERDPGRDMTMLDTVVRNLRGLVGEGHPDVEALALRCRGAKVGNIGTLNGPPMFQRSWALLAHAAHKRADLIPSGMWAQVQASAGLPPFMVWTTDDWVKTVTRRQMARIVLGERATRAQPVVEAPAPPTAEDRLLQAEDADGAAPAAVFEVTVADDTVTTAFNNAPRSARQRALAMNIPPSAFEFLGGGS